MSGGYGGSKRMLWFMAKYANGVSQEKSLGIRFQVIVPRQMILGTGTGDAAANAYAGSDGHHARTVRGPLRRADAAPGVRG